jgi:predicted amino acid dehydrogenase
VRIGVRRKTEKEEEEEEEKKEEEEEKDKDLIITTKKPASHNHVIITVFPMTAHAVINKYHIKYKISRIYQSYNLSSPHDWVLDAN